MTDQQDMQTLERAEAPAMQERRDFLRGLGKWSQAVIGGVLLGGALTVSQQASAGWINRRGGGGGSWVNRRGGGGGSWVNRRGGYGGGSWVNRRGGYGGGAWVNRRY